MKSSECTIIKFTRELQVLQLSTTSERNVLEGCLQIRSLFLGKLKSTVEQSPHTAFIALRHYVHILDMLHACCKRGELWFVWMSSGEMVDGIHPFYIYQLLALLPTWNLCLVHLLKEKRKTSCLSIPNVPLA